jgi:hypothetical protein
MAVESDGTLWTVDDRQVRRGNSVISSGTSNEYSSIAYAPSNGRMWVVASNRNSLYYANVNGNSLNTVNVPGITGGAEELKVHPDGDIYFVSGTGIIRTNSTGSVLNNYNITNTGGLLVDDPRRFDFDNKNNLWVVHNNRLLKIPVAASTAAKNYSYNQDLSNIHDLYVLTISGADTDIIVTKTSGNVATKIR